MGAYADECFNDLVDSISESRDFKHRGMLVLVSKNPKLIQIRLGNRYRVYCNMTGATSGLDYLEFAKANTGERCRRNSSIVSAKHFSSYSGVE